MITFLNHILANTRSLMLTLALIAAGTASLIVGDPVQAQQGSSPAFQTESAATAEQPACDKRVRVVYSGYGEGTRPNCSVR